MSQCEAIQEMMGRWLDSELNAADSEAVRIHVEGCRDCAATRRCLEKIHGSLGDLLKAEASQLEFAPFWREVQRRIDERRPWHDELIEWLRSGLVARRLAWAVPAAIIIVLGFLSFAKWPGGSQISNYASVESIDPHGRNVALLREDETKTTIIWLYQDPEGENENAEDSAKSGPAF